MRAISYENKFLYIFKHDIVEIAIVTKNLKCVIIMIEYGFRMIRSDLMEFKANSGIWGTMFGVPCIIADNFLKLASGDHIKVLLYLLRCSGRYITTDEISSNTGVNSQTVEESVLFWQQANVLTAENGIQPAANIMTPPIQPAQNSTSPTARPAIQEIKQIAENAPQTPKREMLKPSEVSAVLKNSPEISELFKVAEQLLGNINNPMQNSLIWMYNYLGLKTEVIITLIAYCKDIERANPGYIEKIASSWAEKEITTLEIAQEEVERLYASRTFTAEIMRIFDMKRRPTTKQQEIVEIWRNEKYSLDLIKYAYEKTIERIEKLSFEYINKILTSWRENGYSSTDDVKSAESEYRKNKKSSERTSSDGFDAEKYNILINDI